MSVSLLCIAMLMCSCAANDEPGVGANEQQGQKETVDMKKTELTKEQEDLLAALSVNESKVRNGELYEWQEEIIRQYDFAMLYLEQKYSSHDFSFTWCEPAEAGRSYSMFRFLADNESDMYTLYVDITSNETGIQYSCRDNFYGSLIHSDYERELLRFLSEEVPECVDVSSRFSSVYGTECDGSLTFARIRQEQKKISNITTINALSGDKGQEQVFEEIQNRIKNEKIYGSYTVNIYSDNQKSQCVLSRDFQQFD